MPPATFYVALGSNLGDSVRTVLKAFERLAALSVTPVRRSSLWDTTPVDCPPGSGRFVNAVAELAAHPDATPESILPRLQALEREFGRRPKSQHNEARPLDLDLIAWGNLRREGADLLLPHPRAHQRRFVLAPLAELAPELILPGQTRTVRELLGRLPDADEVRPILVEDGDQDHAGR